MSSETATTWKGWVRLPGQRWQAVVSGADEDTVWRLLRQHIEQLPAKLVDSYVGPAGSNPNQKAARRRCY